MAQKKKVTKKVAPKKPRAKKSPYFPKMDTATKQEFKAQKFRKLNAGELARLKKYIASINNGGAGVILVVNVEKKGNKTEAEGIAYVNDVSDELRAKIVLNAMKLPPETLVAHALTAKFSDFGSMVKDFDEEEDEEDE